ncbi:hypothetical protein KI387_006353, partial [Taxus chinensis]
DSSPQNLSKFPAKISDDDPSGGDIGSLATHVFGGVDFGSDDLSNGCNGSVCPSIPIFVPVLEPVFRK